jgi:LPXTG-motif cell wall-anchored protein
MGIVIVMLIIVVGAGWIAWRRRRYRQAHALRISS